VVLARAAWFSADPERKGAFSATDAPRVQDARAALAANASHVREEAQSMKPSRLSNVAIAALGKVALADRRGHVGAVGGGVGARPGGSMTSFNLARIGEGH